MDVHRRDRAAPRDDPGRRAAAGEPARSADRQGRPTVGRSTRARIILQRRSAVAFDGRSSIDRDLLRACSRASCRGRGAPWNALWWTPRIHLALFVHRVDGVAPGLYVLRARSGGARPAAGRVPPRVPLGAGRRRRCRCVCLARGDCRARWRRASAAIRTSRRTVSSASG